MSPPVTPYQPYAAVHADPKGVGDARPTAAQVVADCKAANTLKGRVILITGASSGIGVETARALYKTGAQLYLTARDLEKQEGVIEDIIAHDQASSYPRPQAVAMHLDDLNNVSHAAGLILKKTDKIDILIGNAGVMATPYGLTTDGFETQIATNHFAHLLLFQLLKPALLRAAAASGKFARVITLSSAGHRFGGVRLDDLHWKADRSQYNKWLSYGQSKTANIYMTNFITRNYAKQEIVGLAVHPGRIRSTELGRHMTEEDQGRGGDPVESAKICKSIEQGAATTVWAAISPYFDDAANCGRYLENVGESGPAPEGATGTTPGYYPHIYDEKVEDELWRISCEAIGVPIHG